MLLGGGAVAVDDGQGVLLDRLGAQHLHPVAGIIGNAVAYGAHIQVFIDVAAVIHLPAAFASPGLKHLAVLAKLVLVYRGVVHARPGNRPGIGMQLQFAHDQLGQCLGLHRLGGRGQGAAAGVNARAGNGYRNGLAHHSVGHRVGCGGSAGNFQPAGIPLIGNGGRVGGYLGGEGIAHHRCGGVRPAVDDAYALHLAYGLHLGGGDGVGGAAVLALAGNDHLYLVAHIAVGYGIFGGVSAHLPAVNHPYIIRLSVRGGQRGLQGIAHHRRVVVQGYAGNLVIGHYLAGNGGGNRAGIAANAGYPQLQGLADIIRGNGIGGVGADHLGASAVVAQPFIAHGGFLGPNGLHAQHVAHHRGQGVQNDIGQLVIRVVGQEFILHPAYAGTHAHTVPLGAAFQNRHAGAHAVHANFAVAGAGAGAQAHAIAVAAPNGGIAYGGGIRVIAAAKVQKLGHHIANGAVDADAGPVRALFQHIGHRTHRIGAHHAVAGAGTGAQAHAVAVVAGNHSGTGRHGAAGKLQIVAGHIAGAPIRRFHMVPAAAGAQHLHLGAGIIAGNGAGVIIGRGPEPQPAANHRCVLGNSHGGCRNHADKHERNQQNSQETFHSNHPSEIPHLPWCLQYIRRSTRSNSSLWWNFIVHSFSPVVNRKIWQLRAWGHVFGCVSSWMML